MKLGADSKKPVLSFVEGLTPGLGHSDLGFLSHIYHF